MAVSLQQLQADDSAYADNVQKNPPAAAVAPQTHDDVLDSIQNETGAAKKIGLFQQFGNVAGRVTTNVLDSVVSAADSMYDSEPMKKARDVVAGGMTAAANTGDALVSAAENGPGKPFIQMAGGAGVVNPIWDHAKGSLLDFRDAVAVKDPTLADNLVQGVGQLALPFAGYSRALGGLHTFASTMEAGMVTDATALAPHDARLADLFSLGKQTEGKFGDVLRTLSPDGSALNAYVNYLGDRGDESEAEGRFKNVLDGFGANMIATPLLHTVGMVLKQGTEGLRYAMENGVGSAGDLGSGAAYQEGKIGYHGTPHEIDPVTGFDDSKIGSGEGNQSYGYGHYVAESQDVAGGYAARLSQRVTYPGSALGTAGQVLDMFGGDRVKAVKSLSQLASNASGPEADHFNKAISMVKSGAADSPSGNKYTVDIPDTKINAMLDHDALMKDQPDVLAKIPKPEQEQLSSFLEERNENSNGDLSELTGGQFRKLLERAHEDDVLMPSDGMETNMPKATSRYLADKGVPGIKYLDGTSRKGGEGTRNFVLFNGRDAQITHKNGLPVGNQDMNLSKEERAIERERIAAVRDKEEGRTREFEPEPIPANAARVEGEAARRDRAGDKDLPAPKLDKLSPKEIQDQIDALRAEAERRRGADPDAKIEGSRK